MSKFKKGDKVRENRQGAQTETVISVEGNVLTTNKGTLHASKAILVAQDADIPLPKNITTTRQSLEFLAKPGEKSALATAFKEWEKWQSAPAAKAKPPSKTSRALIKTIASRNSKVASAVAGVLMQMENSYN